MKINFKEMQEQNIPGFKGGEGVFSVKMYSDDACKIMHGRLVPGASIGLHTHETNSEMIYILSGTGKVLYDDTKEILEPGDSHLCPKGHCHSLINEGAEDLLFFAVVPEQ